MAEVLTPNFIANDTLQAAISCGQKRPALDEIYIIQRRRTGVSDGIFQIKRLALSQVM
ncbi:MAG: hypothetical protein ANABAC_2058 [Anaerolineae bacterium]|nr:MAG: hypothetical protein ANABAC_2058 [Anaerolineae bacterium]